jgi:hypothetical protein
MHLKDDHLSFAHHISPSIFSKKYTQNFHIKVAKFTAAKQHYMKVHELIGGNYPCILILAHGTSGWLQTLVVLYSRRKPVVTTGQK